MQDNGNGIHRPAFAGADMLIKGLPSEGGYLLNKRSERFIDVMRRTPKTRRGRDVVARSARDQSVKVAAVMVRRGPHAETAAGKSSIRLPGILEAFPYLRSRDR